jgi:GntR family transcriptional regulator of vanillate catabolism
LAHIGLLEVRSSGGFSVRAFTVSEVRDAIEIRGVLEGTAARLAAERLRDPSELDVLRKCEEGVVASQMADDAFKDYIIQNERFHQELVSLAKSPMLSRLVSQVYALPFASPSAMVTPTAVLPSAESSVRLGLMHHESIIAAIEARQGARAEHIAREHALHSWDVFKEALSSESAIARIPGQKVIQGKA